MTIWCVALASATGPPADKINREISNLLEGLTLAIPGDAPLLAAISGKEPFFATEGRAVIAGALRAVPDALAAPAAAVKLMLSGAAYFISLTTAGGEPAFIAFSGSELTPHDEPRLLDLVRALAPDFIYGQARGEVPAAEVPVGTPPGIRQSTSGTSSRIVLDRILQDLKRVMPLAGACFLMTLDDGLELASYLGPDPDESTVGLEIRSIRLKGPNQHAKLADALNDKRFPPEFNGLSSDQHGRRWLSAPVVARSETIGFLIVVRRARTSLTSTEIAVARAFAGQAAVAIDNIRLADELRRMLRFARSQAARLEQVVDIIPDGVVMLDEKRRVLVVNRAAEAYLAQLAGVGKGQIVETIGGHPFDIFLPSQAAEGAWREVTMPETGFVFELSVRALLEPAAGEGWLVIIRNVTDVRREQRYLQAQERLASVGQLAAGIAHDFNNILAIISLYTQMVSRVPDLDDGNRRRLNTVQSQAERAAHLVAKMLDFSRQTRSDLKPIELNHFVCEWANSYGGRLPDGIELQVDVPVDESLILGDPDRLRQTLVNLFLNACDAMTGGGRITLRLQPLVLEPHQPYPLPDLTPGSWLRLEVADTGSGIQPKDLARIFDPFFTTREVEQRSGLGLAQVYGIVKGHGGLIDVHSLPGQGTTFSLYFPAFDVPAGRPSPMPESSMALGQGETILLVEDDPPTLQALEEIMGALNYRPLTARDGQEALALLRASEGVDVVISDMVMPVMGGATLFAELSTSYPKTRLIMITGYPMDDAGVAESIGRDVAFVQKPLRIEEMARIIRAVLDSR